MQLEVKRSPFLWSVPSWKETHGLGLADTLYTTYISKSGKTGEWDPRPRLNTLSMDTSESDIQF